MEVVELREGDGQKHLDKILNDLDRHLTAKAHLVIEGNQDAVNNISVKIQDIRHKYNEYKRGYRL
jgi:hypothetical protein